MNTSLLVWIVLAPLLGSILSGLLYFYHIKKSKVSDIYFSLIGTITPLISFLITLSLFLRMNDEKIIFKQHLFTWLNVDKLNIEMAFLGDNLSIFMSMFVTFVGWLIHIYAIGYMKGDNGFGKFFAYFNLFLASMLILVLADNPIILFIGWEGVGVCSYLLIKFYYGNAQNVLAANKAFIVNRVGDFGFLLGVVTLFFALGQVDLSFGSIEANLVDMIKRAQLRIREGVEEPLTIQQLAEDFGISYSTFRKLFKEYTGISPALYQQDLRLQRAKELLTSTDLSVKEIAYRLNFETPDYFSSRFKIKTGRKPSELR